MNVAELICRNARTTPRADALIDPADNRRLSFADLDERTAALACALVELGVRPGDRCAILARNCLEYFEIYLACARMGAIAHGMNWRLSTAAMGEALEDFEPTVVFAHSEFAAMEETLQRDYAEAQWFDFGDASDGSYEDLLSSKLGSLRLPVRDDPDEPFLILYTGGTSGNSKGAVHSHATVLAAMANNTIAERVQPATDKYALLGQAFHSAVVLALNYLRHGCPVVVINYQTELALQVIEDEGVTALLGFAAMLNHMLDHAGAHRLDSLRNIQYGGGLWAPGSIRALMDHFPCTLIQCYGTTESVGVTFLTQEDHAAAGARPELLTSCGRAAFLTDIRIEPEPDRAAVGPYPVGELHVRSPSNTLGYWVDYKRDPRSRPPAWLPTGDSGYVDESGYLHLVGRTKDVIRSGGENIYAGQVENAIYEHPAVLETAVIGVPDERFGEAVLALVVLKAAGKATADEIRASVALQLGSYQKPKHVEFVSELPKAPTGKIAKHLLRDEWGDGREVMG